MVKPGVEDVIDLLYDSPRVHVIVEVGHLRQYQLARLRLKCRPIASISSPDVSETEQGNRSLLFN